MTDDQFWRIVIGAGAVAGLGAIWPMFMAWLKKHGYTGWK